MSVLDPRTLRVLWMIATTSRFRKGLRLDYVGRELEIRAEAGAGAKLQATAADLDAHVGVRPARSGRSRRGGTFERVRGPSDSD